jgi:hypothetical protein
MCLQFWEWPAYRDLKGQFPVNAAARVEAATVLFRANGPLAEYWRDLEPLLVQLKSYEANRHLFAHGHLMLTNANSIPSVHLRLRFARKHSIAAGRPLRRCRPSFESCRVRNPIAPDFPGRGTTTDSGTRRRWPFGPIMLMHNNPRIWHRVDGRDRTRRDAPMLGPTSPQRTSDGDAVGAADPRRVRTLCILDGTRAMPSKAAIRVR